MELAHRLTAPNPNFSPRIPRISHLTSHVSRLTLHVSRFTSHVSRFTLLLFCIGALVFSPLVSADSEAWAQEMELANRAYEEGNFAAAAARYENIIAAGVVDGRVYYNLGNAYFKQGELGMAIVNYERAHRLLPRDEDVAANLAFAREQIVDRVEVPPQSAVEQAAAIWQSLFTVNEMTWLATVMYWLMCLGALAAVFWQRRRRELLYVVGVAALVLVLTLTSFVFKVRGAAIPEGIVTTSAVDIRSGPGADYTTEFTVHEGTKLTIEERRDAWLRVRLVGDLQGWIEADAVVEI